MVMSARATPLPRPAIFELIAELSRMEGLVLDPVYTGKAFAGMVAEIATGRFEGCRDIVFVHTGGIFGVFPQRAGFAAMVAGGPVAQTLQ